LYISQMACTSERLFWSSVFSCGGLVWQVPEQFLSFSLINEGWVVSARMASEEVYD